MFEPLKPGASTGASSRADLCFSVPISAHNPSFDMLVDMALEKIVNKASAQITDIVDKAVERAVDRLSNNANDFQAPTAKTASQQEAVADAAAAPDHGDSSESPQQDATAVGGTTAIVSLQPTRIEDKCPRPNCIYAIHLKNYHDYVLASDDYWATLLRPPADAHPDFFESLYCHWLCEEWRGWLSFRNLDTGKYLGIEYGRQVLSKPVLSADHDSPAVKSRFCVTPDDLGHCALRTPLDNNLLAIQALLVDERDTQSQLGNLKQKVALVCKQTFEQACLPSSWSFEEVDP